MRRRGILYLSLYFTFLYFITNGVFFLRTPYIFSLVDNYLEPAVGSPGWESLQPLVGNMPGAGMGLYIVICGAIWLVGPLLVYVLPAVRHMEKDLPNYRPVVATAVETQLLT